MDKIQLLSSLDFGNSIAEYDKNLSKYFIKTDSVEELINDRYDIVRGVKGSGKTAMLIALCTNQYEYEQLQNVKLVQAINLKGDPDFKRVFDEISEKIEEQNLIDAWKVYIINLVWKNIIDALSGHEKLEEYLKENNLISNSNNFLGKISYAFKRVKIKISNTINFDGTTTQAFELGMNNDKNEELLTCKIIDFNYIFSEIDKILIKNDLKVWVMMDRLDDAFPDKTLKSILALKCLLYAYKDISIYENFKIKIFIRDDIYTNISKNGFTSLTHVAAKAMNSIRWNKSKLVQLIVDRLLFNDKFKEYLIENRINYSELDEEHKNAIMELLFRKQVDIGKKNPDTLGWIINHITDGLNIYTPRDLINMLDKAREYQIEEWKLNNNSSSENYLIGPSALRKAYSDISREKLEVQLYAEYPDLRKHIEKFKDSKAEHNEESLKALLGSRWKSIIKKLVDIGFIEERSNTWKIPFIYREGLNISQGKAF